MFTQCRIWIGMLCAAAALTVLINPSAARAQTLNSSADTELLLSYEPIIITASKTAQKISDSPSAVTVINGETIRLSGATTIPEILRLAPAVDVMEANQSMENVGIRGFNGFFSNKLLVMVDGRSIYQDLFGGIFWNMNTLLISRIKRIEIVRGPGSALYGANAFDGVINILTKTPQEMLAAGHATVRLIAGEHNSRFAESAVSGGDPSGWSYTLGVAENRTDGYGERKASAVRDSYHVPIVTFDAQRQLSRGSLLVSLGSTVGAKADFSSPFVLARDGDWRNYHASLTYHEDKVRNPIMVRLYTNSAVQNNIGDNDHDTKCDFEIQRQHALSKGHSMVYGGNYRYTTEFATPTGPSPHSAELWSLYAQDEFHATPRTSLFTGLRLDHYSQFGSNITPRISLVHHMPGARTFRFSYGSAFRAASPLETYLDSTSPLFGGLTLHLLGNPNLKPEKVASFEAGYRQEMVKGGFIGINLFDNRLTNLIESVPTEFAPSPFPAGIPTVITRINAGSAHTRGFEIESELPIADGLRGLFNYSYEDARDDAGAPIAFTPRYKASLTVEGNMSDHLTGYLSGRYIGASIFADSQGMTHPISAYMQVDVRFGYTMGGHEKPWRLSIGATNLLDDKHLEYPAIQELVPVPLTAPHTRTVWLGVDGKL